MGRPKRPGRDPILSRLTANQGKPWHANEFKEINMLYQKKLRELFLLGGAGAEKICPLLRDDGPDLTILR